MVELYSSNGFTKDVKARTSELWSLVGVLFDDSVDFTQSRASRCSTYKY